MIGIILGIVSFVAALYLDHKAALAAERIAARNAAAEALRKAAQYEAQAAALGEECAEKAAKLQALRDKGLRLSKEAQDLFDELGVKGNQANRFKDEVENLRSSAQNLAEQARGKGVPLPPSFFERIKKLQFSARGLGSKIFAAISAVATISSLITIIQDQLQQMDDEANNISNEPCDEGSGISNLGVNEAELLDLLNLE